MFFRVVDNDSLLDDKGKFEIPKGTLTLNGNGLYSRCCSTRKIIFI